ncbi:MAG: hypothetical protein C4532_04405 [Candidatus Abyssobacteria bacterium SURF_17]|jgi:hypothetical protein|uniref:Uncharacterized protein n=1 Tax=Candidatus Abyssobacteria bacterium SURF_17 TaxID=2093361 RepID=A0A419F4P0_9BACT|nr:MAG: hypothetical protein C4532_04405 [Candidatus Abyssubacteria bacterium SURF_17]
MGFRTEMRKSWGLMVVLWLLVGCSSADKARIPAEPDPVITEQATDEELRRILSAKLTRQMEFLEQNKERYKEEVVTVPSGGDNYYYKYYDEFPEGPEETSIVVTKAETFSPSHIADVKYRKVRYQTRYSRSPGKAEDDKDFIRDEGVQKETYEFDGQFWRLRNSTFEVTKTSVFRNDQWRVSQGRISRVEEEKPEYFVDKVRTLFGLLD